MKINCLSCGHKVELDDAYSGYEGEIRCLICAALLHVRIEEGSVRSVRLARQVVARPAAALPRSPAAVNS
ncbi:MAG: hypothetical protein HY321_16550 [Armatimonadetes bacterium]|nr:hypothetical protein [Armatimonadota bacterium]